MGISEELGSMHGIFPHLCEQRGCEQIVIFDDEPYCYEHSPDEGSSFKDYSAMRTARGAGKLPTKITIEFELWCTPFMMNTLKSSIKNCISEKTRATGGPWHSYKETHEQG